MRPPRRRRRRRAARRSPLLLGAGLEALRQRELQGGAAGVQHRRAEEPGQPALLPPARAMLPHAGPVRRGHGGVFDGHQGQPAVRRCVLRTRRQRCRPPGARKPPLTQRHHGSPAAAAAAARRRLLWPWGLLPAPGQAGRGDGGVQPGAPARPQVRRGVLGPRRLPAGAGSRAALSLSPRAGGRAEWPCRPQGNFDAGIEEFTAALAADPNYERAYFGRAECLRCKGELRKAEVRGAKPQTHAPQPH